MFQTTVTDAGDYKCIIKNEAGDITKIVQIAAEGIMNFHTYFD